MQEWSWIGRDVAVTLHADQIAEHGGAAGTRDEGGMESALARPLNLAADGTPDAAELAAAYAYGLARNHPFVDGNKRTAAVVSITFLIVNGLDCSASPADVVVAFLALAAGELTEDEMADWFRRHIVPR